MENKFFAFSIIALLVSLFRLPVLFTSDSISSIILSGDPSLEILGQFVALTIGEQSLEDELDELERVTLLNTGWLGAELIIMWGDFNGWSKLQVKPEQTVGSLMKN
jgi:hypothetical protein